MFLEDKHPIHQTLCEITGCACVAYLRTWVWILVKERRGKCFHLNYWQILKRHNKESVFTWEYVFMKNIKQIQTRVPTREGPLNFDSTWWDTSYKNVWHQDSNCTLKNVWAHTDGLWPAATDNEIYSSTIQLWSHCICISTSYASHVVRSADGEVLR